MTYKNTLDLLTDMRKTIHENPELSGHEYETQKRILEFLSVHSSLANASKVAGTGVLAVFDSGHSGPVIMIRADIDALPIQETNTFSHRSKTHSVSHKCGHDGHTVILLGLAIELTRNPIDRGKILLLFQPSEENGLGAQAVLKDKLFQKISIDYVFALHNLPGFSKNEIVLKEQEFTSNVKSIIIKLRGKTSHAAEPEKGHNPSTVIASILHFAEHHTHNYPDSDDFFLITPVYITMGEKAYGISAGYGEVHLTIRGWSVPLMRKNCILFENYISGLCKKHTLDLEISWLQEFHASINHPDAVDIALQAVKKNSFDANKVSLPFKWGEDFGLFTQKYKGAMFGLGAGVKAPALHNPDYEFPDEIIQTGVKMFLGIIEEILTS